MKIIYKKGVVERILEAKRETQQRGEEIEVIHITKAEYTVVYDYCTSRASALSTMPAPWEVEHGLKFQFFGVAIHVAAPD